MKKLFLTIVYLSAAFFFAFCGKKNKEACTLNCLNGGSCVDNACDCPPKWSGTDCDTYFTKKAEGRYSSTDYTCSTASQATLTEFDVRVDSTNRDRLWIGSIPVTMTSLTDFCDNAGNATECGYHGSFDPTYQHIYINRRYGVNGVGGPLWVWAFCDGHFSRK